MTEVKELTTDIVAKLKEPLPKKAISQHPSKKYMSSIKVIYMIERLNEVFGVNGWQDSYDIIENSADSKMIVVNGRLEIPSFGIVRKAFGGNDNPDRGDAYKGACTDAMSKMCSQLYIGMDVYKGNDESGEPRKTFGDLSKPFVMSATVMEAETVKEEVLAKMLNDLGESIWRIPKEQSEDGKKLLNAVGEVRDAMVMDTGTQLKKKPVFRVVMLDPKTEDIQRITKEAKK